MGRIDKSRGEDQGTTGSCLSRRYIGGKGEVRNGRVGNPVSIEKSFEISVEILIAGMKTLED